MVKRYLMQLDQITELEKLNLNDQQQSNFKSVWIIFTANMN